MTSYKPEVQTDGTGKWYGNALRFASSEEAKVWADDLSMRWFAVRATRATESDEPVTHALDLNTRELTGVTP